jgi:hypothetical protein
MDKLRVIIIAINLSGSAVWGTGSGNIFGDPYFLNPFAGNLAINCQSLCLNAGNNTYPTATNDILGNPRITAGTVDMGAYETNYSPPTITASAVPSFTVCDGEMMSLIGSGAFFYNWTGGYRIMYLLHPLFPTLTL